MITLNTITQKETIVQDKTTRGIETNRVEGIGFMILGIGIMAISLFFKRKEMS